MITPGAAQTGQNGLTFMGYDDIIKAVREYAIITAALRSSCLFLILPGVYSNMKTVKQLAAEQNTTKQIIHRIIKRERIETIQNGNRLLIDSEAEKAILQALQLHEAANRTAPDDSKRFKTIQRRPALSRIHRRTSSSGSSSNSSGKLSRISGKKTNSSQQKKPA